MNEKHLLAAVRYIHNNPVKANMVKELFQYPWSSYNEYVGKEDAGSGLTDRDLILKMFSDNEKRAVKQYIKFSREQAMMNS